MKLALELFYIVGGLLFYYAKTSLEPMIFLKSSDEKDECTDIFENHRTMYNVIVLIMSILWPIFLVTNFICLLISIFLTFTNRD